MKATALLATALLVAACASKGIEDPVDIGHMSFDMQQGTNGNRPARLELVRVDDEQLVRELVGTATADWFGAAGEAFRRANPDAVYDAWELVPGRASGPFDVEASGDLAAVLFCDMHSEPPPLRIADGGRVHVHVSDGCTVYGGRRAEPFWDRLRLRRLVRVSFSMGADAGSHGPVRVELVRSPSPDIVDELARLDPQSWFADSGGAFRRTHRDVLLDRWELVADGTYGPFRFAVDGDTEGLLFCSGSDQPLRIAWRRDIDVLVDGKGCDLAHALPPADESRSLDRLTLRPVR